MWEGKWEQTMSKMAAFTCGCTMLPLECSFVGSEGVEGQKRVPVLILIF